MRVFIISICLLLFYGNAFSQKRNLNYYLEKAKTNSPLINKSKNDSKILELDLVQIKNLLSKPKIALEGQVLLSPIISHDNSKNKLQMISKGANSYTGYDFSYSDGGQYQAMITLNQPLLQGSVYEVFAQNNELLRKQNKNDIVLTKHELEQLVSHQYLLCLKLKKQAEISQSLVGKLNQQLQIMQKLVANAIYKKADLMLMQIEIKNFEIELWTYQNEFQNNLSDLNLLCGIQDSDDVEIADVNFKLGEDILVDSKFLIKYQLDSLSIKGKQLLFEQKYKAQLNLFANTGMNAVYQPAFNRLGLAAGLNLSWTIFDGNQKKIQSEKSLIQMQTVAFEKKNFILQNFINKNKYLTQLRLIEKRIQISKEQLDDYQELMDRYSVALRQAQISVMDFKNLVRDISEKKQAFLLLEMQRQVLINLYNYWNF